MDNFVETSSGVLMVSNGFDGIQRWDGATQSMEAAGLAAPTSGVTVAGSGNGAIVGTYYAYLRFVDRLGYFSNLSPISLPFTAQSLTGAITAASNASPISITSAGHGLSTGTVVKITGIGGNTQANNTWFITVVDANTFTLDDSHADGDYDGGGTWAAGVATANYSGVQIPTDPKVTRRQILRNTDGQAETFYVDVDTEDLTSTTFSSTYTDTLLAAGAAVPILDSDGLPMANLNYTPPTHKAVLVNHLDRMFAMVQHDETRGTVKVTTGSTTVYGVGTDWVLGLQNRYLYVVGAVNSYQIDSVDVALQTLTLTEPYADVTDLFGVYAIRPAPAERRLVYFTPAGRPESWPPTYALSVQEDGDDITGGMTRGPFLYILEQRHIYKLTFQDDPLKDGAIFLSANRGCINQRCWVLVDNNAFMLDEYGIHKFSGSSDNEPVSRPVANMFRWNSAYKFHINWKASQFFHACLYRPQETIRWFICLGGSYVPRWALCYHYILERWWLEEYRIGIGAAVSGRITGLPYVILGTECKKVCAMWEGTTDIADPTKGTIRGTATSAGLMTLTDSRAAFAASGVGSVVNAPVTIVFGTGKGQTRRIVSVSTTTITVDQPWTVSLDTTSVYQIGGVIWTYKTSQLRYAPSEELANRNIEILFSPVSAPCLADLRIRHDFAQNADTQRLSYSSAQGAGLRTDSGLPDMPIDLTKAGGLITHVIPGHKVNALHGKRHVQLELSGVTNSDLVSIYELQVEGTGNLAELGKQ